MGLCFSPGPDVLYLGRIRNPAPRGAGHLRRAPRDQDREGWGSRSKLLREWVSSFLTSRKPHCPCVGGGLNLERVKDFPWPVRGGHWHCGTWPWVWVLGQIASYKTHLSGLLLELLSLHTSEVLISLHMDEMCPYD